MQYPSVICWLHSAHSLTAVLPQLLYFRKRCNINEDKLSIQNAGNDIACYPLDAQIAYSSLLQGELYHFYQSFVPEKRR